MKKVKSSSLYFSFMSKKGSCSQSCILHERSVLFQLLSRDYFQSTVLTNVISSATVCCIFPTMVYYISATLLCSQLLFPALLSSCAGHLKQLLDLWSVFPEVTHKVSSLINSTSSVKYVVILHHSFPHSFDLVLLHFVFKEMKGISFLV